MMFSLFRKRPPVPVGPACPSCSVPLSEISPPHKLRGGVCFDCAIARILDRHFPCVRSRRHWERVERIIEAHSSLADQERTP